MVSWLLQSLHVVLIRATVGMLLPTYRRTVQFTCTAHTEAAGHVISGCIVHQTTAKTSKQHGKAYEATSMQDVSPW